MTDTKKVHYLVHLDRDTDAPIAACHTAEDDPIIRSVVENITCETCVLFAKPYYVLTQIDLNAIITRLMSLPHAAEAVEESGLIPGKGMAIQYVLEWLDSYVEIAKRRDEQMEEVHQQYHELVDQREAVRDFLFG